MEKNLLEALEKCFKVYEDTNELETWTDGGYNIILSVEKWTEEEVMKAVEDFDPCHEIEIWWGNDSFRANYNGSMRDAQDDMEEWQRNTLKELKELLHPVEMKEAFMFLTVRMGIRYPKSMDEGEAVETVYQNVDYNFNTPDWCSVEVIDTEIRDVFQ